MHMHSDDTQNPYKIATALQLQLYDWINLGVTRVGPSRLHKHTLQY